MQRKHQQEMIRYAKSPKSTGVWQKCDNTWKLTPAVFWHSDTIYIVDDEYAELRKAYEDGKVIEESCDEYEGACQWCDVKDNNLTRNIKYYRIKPTTETRWQWLYKIDRSKSNYGYSSDWNFGETFMTNVEACDKFLAADNIIEWFRIEQSAKEFEI